MIAPVMIDASPHPSQLAVHLHPSRFKILACGRRWGKTRLGVNECFDTASQGGRAWWVAPSYKMSQVGWRPIQSIAYKAGAEVRKGDMQIVLPGGGEISVRSADNPQSLRGEGLDLVVVDECAYIFEEAWTEALRPSLSDRQGRSIFISTPKGRNWFWRLFTMGLGDDPSFRSWQLPTSDNPFISPDEIEAARLTLPDLIFQQEYLAVFLENQGVVFRNLAACMGAPASTPNEHEGHNIVAGGDWGKQNDFTALSIGCATCKQEVARDRFNKIDYDFQRSRLASLFNVWRPSTILLEANSVGDPNLTALQRSGLPVVAFDTTAATKPPLIENLSLVFDRAEWQFQDDRIWKAELEAYERQVSPVTGRSQYSAPVGMHDDTVIGRALMVWAGSHFIRLPDQPEQPSRWNVDRQDGSRWRRY